MTVGDRSPLVTKSLPKMKTSGTKALLRKLNEEKRVPSPGKVAAEVVGEVVGVEYVDMPVKSQVAMPESFVGPRPRSRMCEPLGGRRLPSREALTRDKSRSAWTNYVSEEGPHWKNDLDGMKGFLAACYRQTRVPYLDPEIYETKALPQQYNPAKNPDTNKLHPPDLVDPQNPDSLCAYGLGLEPVRHIPPWDNSPHIVVVVSHTYSGGGRRRYGRACG